MTVVLAAIGDRNRLRHHCMLVVVAKLPADACEGQLKLADAISVRNWADADIDLTLPVRSSSSAFSLSREETYFILHPRSNAKRVETSYSKGHTRVVYSKRQPKVDLRDQILRYVDYTKRNSYPNQVDIRL